MAAIYLGQGRGRCINLDSFRLGKINGDLNSLLNVLLSLPGLGQGRAAILLGDSFDPVTGIWHDLSGDGNDFPPDTNKPTVGIPFNGRRTVDFRGTKGAGTLQALQVPLAIRNPTSMGWTVLAGVQSDHVTTAAICNLGQAFGESATPTYGPYFYANNGGNNGWFSFFDGSKFTSQSLLTMRQISCDWRQPALGIVNSGQVTMRTDGPASKIAISSTAAALAATPGGGGDDHAALGADGLLADNGVLGLDGFMTHFIVLPGPLSSYDIDRARQALQDYYGFPP